MRAAARDGERLPHKVNTREQLKTSVQVRPEILQESDQYSQSLFRIISNYLNKVWGSLSEFSGTLTYNL